MFPETDITNTEPLETSELSSVPDEPINETEDIERYAQLYLFIRFPYFTKWWLLKHVIISNAHAVRITHVSPQLSLDLILMVISRTNLTLK